MVGVTDKGLKICSVVPELETVAEKITAECSGSKDAVFEEKKVEKKNGTSTISQASISGTACSKLESTLPVIGSVMESEYTSTLNQAADDKTNATTNSNDTGTDTGNDVQPVVVHKNKKPAPAPPGNFFYTPPVIFEKKVRENVKSSPCAAHVPGAEVSNTATVERVKSKVESVESSASPHEQDNSSSSAEVFPGAEVSNKGKVPEKSPRFNVSSNLKNTSPEVKSSAINQVVRIKTDIKKKKKET